MTFAKWLLSAALTLLLAAQSSWAQDVTDVLEKPSASSSSNPASSNPPTRKARHPLTPMQDENTTLRSIGDGALFDFSVRGDELVTKAALDLHFIPSPSLLTQVSHIKAYLNDELVGVIPIDPKRLGEPQQHQLTLDPRLIRDFNRLRLRMIGHYTDICEDPAHTSLWIDITKDSQLSLTLEALPLVNELALLPAPFFDQGDSRALDLPIVLPAKPDLGIQRAGAIMAGYFGAQSDWRGQNFPAIFDTGGSNTPPRQHSLVLATNDQRPDFLKDRLLVNGPTVELISHPETPYVKLLLIMGRNSEELLTAAKSVAIGTPLLRGQSAMIDHLKQLSPRTPYDAPNWIPTDRPVTFGELIDFPQQLMTQGLTPRPIALSANLPPDLLTWQGEDIALDVGYRYSPPATNGDSRLDISINERFLESLPMETQQEEGERRLSLPLINTLLAGQQNVTIPVFKVGTQNRIRFTFRYANRLGNAEPDSCRTLVPVEHLANVDESSTLDFTGYPHYIAMPALGAFVNAGFPFSRLADLADTLVVMPESPSQAELSSLFNAIGRIGAQTGYPGTEVSLTDDWEVAAGEDKDILAIGNLPVSMEDNPAVVRFNAQAPDRVRLSRSRRDVSPMDKLRPSTHLETQDISLIAQGPMAALVGLESPWQTQRSIVALLAVTQKDHQMLNDTLAIPDNLDAIHGSLAIMRMSGVTSEHLEARYFVGSLPWLTYLQYHLAIYPWLIAIIALISLLILAVLIWWALRHISARRLRSEGD